MNPDAITAISDGADRFHEQSTTGEWAGPGQIDWLSGRYPCGRLRDGPGRKCPCAPGARGHRGLPPWSQVMAVDPTPRGWGE